MELLGFVVAVVIAIIIFIKVKNSFQKHGRAKALSILMGISASFVVLAILVVLMASFFESETKSHEYKLLRVTDFSYTMGEKQSVSIAIGKNNSNYFDVTIHRDQVKEGITLVREKTKDYDSQNEWKTKVIDASATLEKINYFFSLKDDYHSVIKFKVNELNYSKKEANIDVYLKLVNPNTNKYISLDKKNLIIQGKMFDNLTKKL